MNTSYIRDTGVLAGRNDGFVMIFFCKTETDCSSKQNFRIPAKMNFEVIGVEKAIEQRREEYTEIYNLYGYDEVDDYSKMWSAYLIASTMESTGWLALWKLSKKSCIEYDINFSRSFLATVNEVDYTTLSAEIELVEGEEGERFNLPRKLTVPLVDLYITLEQDDNILFATATAECLDQLRVFYKYLWWPWDADARESSNWFSENLPFRLKLFHDIKLGNYSEPIIKNIKTLIERGKFFYDACLRESDALPQDNVADSETQKKIVTYVRNLELIKASLEVFKNDSWRKTLSYIKQDKLTPEAFLVVNEFSLSNLIHYTREISDSHHGIKLNQIGRDLGNVLSQYENYDIIFMSPEEHALSSECLNANVTVKNLTRENAVINARSPFWYGLKTTADNICLQNLIIRSQENFVMIYVKEGVTLMDSVTMIGSVPKSQKAIIVGEKATFLANKCQFNGFSSGITCLPGSAVQLTDCVFQNNHVAIDVVGDAQICLNNVSALQSEKAFIRYEGDSPHNEIKSLEELKDIPSFSLKCIKLDNEELAVQFV